MLNTPNAASAVSLMTGSAYTPHVLIRSNVPAGPVTWLLAVENVVTRPVRETSVTLLQRRIIIDVFHDDFVRLACRVEHFEAQISCELDGLRSSENLHHLRFRQVPYIDEHQHIMNQGGASARVKKELSLCKSSGCLQAVLLMICAMRLSPYRVAL